MKRSEMNKEYFWNLKDIYESFEAWDKAYKETEKEAKFGEFKGKLGEKKNLLACLKKQDSVMRKLERLYVFAHMLNDQDTADAQNSTYISRAQGLLVKINAETAYMLPELTALDESVLKGFISDPDFSDYDYMLKTVLKSKAHVLGEEAEKVLALGGEMYAGFRDAFMMVDNADLPFPTVKDSEGRKYKVTHGGYSVCMASHDRELRRKAFKAYYKAYIGLINTITATYSGSVKKDVFLARARKYLSCLESALANEDVVPEVYENLLEAVHGALPLMHKYIAAKKQTLGLEQMHMYDMYVPVLENVDLKLEYEEAYELVKKGLAPLGEEYVALLQKAKDEKWIDVYENDGKRSGAYSTGCFEVHPYVLLNYQKTTHDVFTIAHEMGHSIHTYFSNRTQPFAKADYKIFVAEVASTVNEVLLLRYILSTAEDKKLKKYLLSYLLEMIRTTLFRQTQFAEFEYAAHTMAEKGQPLTKEVLCKKYLKLNKDYYGKAVVSDKEISYEWARIPHFYTPFYVYKYATGITSALFIANRILTEGESAVKDYFAFLSSGGSDNPVELLKIAGVDLTKKDAFVGAMKVFEETLDEFIAL